jgi:hypothetical protein
VIGWALAALLLSFMPLSAFFAINAGSLSRQRSSSACA